LNGTEIREAYNGTKFVVKSTCVGHDIRTINLLLFNKLCFKRKAVFWQVLTLCSDSGYTKEAALNLLREFKNYKWKEDISGKATTER
jgi:hypothetical protein